MLDDYEAVFDITIRLGAESTNWPGDPPYRREMVSSLAAGDISDVSLLHLTAHTGTHIDTPGHFLPAGRRLDDYPAEDFLRPACVVEWTGGPLVPPAAVETADVRPGDAVLFKTTNSTRGKITAGRFFRDGVALSPAAAEALLQRRVALVGIDYFTVDPFGADFPVHLRLLGAGVLILETVNLAAVAPGRYTLVCLPLRLAGAEASPVRAVLLRRRPGP